MKSCRSIWQALKIAALAAVCCLVLAGPALARRTPEPEEEKSSGKGSEVTAWTLPYGLTILGVTLGMLFVVRSSRRRDRARPEGFEGGQLPEEEEKEDKKKKKKEKKY